MENTFGITHQHYLQAHQQPQQGIQKPSIEEVLEDLATRFITHLPEDELNSLERIGFHIEEAHWFYEDFSREQNSNLPAWNLKEFAFQMFNFCAPLKHFLTQYSVDEIVGVFSHYKYLSKVLLVKGFNPRSIWTFPKGKINKDEGEIECALREVLEETGFDASNYIDNECIPITIGEQKNTYFFIPGVQDETIFEPKSRKEISKIEWKSIQEIEKESYSQYSYLYRWVMPFIKKIRAYIKKKKLHKNKKLKYSPNQSYSSFTQPQPYSPSYQSQPPSQSSSHFFSPSPLRQLQPYSPSSQSPSSYVSPVNVNHTISYSSPQASFITFQEESENHPFQTFHFDRASILQTLRSHLIPNSSQYNA